MYIAALVIVRLLYLVFILGSRFETDKHFRSSLIFVGESGTPLANLD
jgi:hypothetical protein